MSCGLDLTLDSAVARDLFCAPSFFVEDELYFGKDSLVAVETALTEQ